MMYPKGTKFEIKDSKKKGEYTVWIYQPNKPEIHVPEFVSEDEAQEWIQQHTHSDD